MSAGGNVGGARAIEQVRTVAVELGAAPLRNAVHILPDILVPAMKAPSYDPTLLAPLDGKLDELVSELLWWTEGTARRPPADRGRRGMTGVRRAARKTVLVTAAGGSWRASGRWLSQGAMAAVVVVVVFPVADDHPGVDK